MSTTMMAAPTGATLKKSNLTKQFEHGDAALTPTSNKFRPLSDTSPIPTTPSLSPSPAIREPGRRESKDDTSIIGSPVTPRRPSYHMRGLSLQMTPMESSDGSTNNPNAPRVPLSPKLESASIYGSPASTLPRRSRGLDFARASTNLHQTTLAESSPDASPIAGRGINIPQRRGLRNNSILESPSQNPIWSSLHGEKTNLSSSVSSINMMDSDSDSDASSEDMAVDREMDDPMLNTPAASKMNGLALTNSPGMDWLNNGPTNSQMSLLNFQPHRMNFRRSGLRHPKSSQSSSSVSMRSSKPSPGAPSPPLRPSVESSGYFGMTRQQVRSRRESLSLGTDDLVLSDSEGDVDNKPSNEASSNDASSERGVVRRAVTRRSNLMPKTKGFARIRAALMEESDPLHTEARREAEVIKQVHESDAVYTNKPATSLDVNATAEPVEVSIESSNDNDLSHEVSNESNGSDMQAAEPFSTHAKRHSAGLGFWNTFENTPPSNVDRYRTPPPPSLMQQDSNVSDDVMSTWHTPLYDSTQVGSLIRQLHQSRSRSRSTTPLASAIASQALSNVQGNNNQAPTAGDVARKVNNKRRRDDDFDPASFKRRAVSPSMVGSTQSSPIVPQSPTLVADKTWGRPPAKTHADRSNSGGSTTAGGPKRVGLQGMTEASDGFMGMSID